MVSNAWRAVTIGDLAAGKKNALVGGPFGSNLVSADYVPAGIPVIRGQNMGFGRWVGGEFVFVSSEKAEELAANIAVPGDIVLTQRGTLGQVAIIPEDPFGRYIVSQSQMKISVDESKVDSLFLYYVFTSEKQRDYIRRNSIQTGVPHTNLGILRDTPIHLPPLNEQREIARVLGVLDDKIELNHRMNQTLETTARALFKSWFVDYDPVRDRNPLFPKSFEASSLGPIPEGWLIGRLDNLLVLQRGFDLPSSRRVPGPYPVVAASGPSGTHVEAMVKGPGVITGRSGVLGGVYLVLEDFWPLNTSLWVKEFLVSRPAHAYFLLQSLDFSLFNAGSAVPTLNRNHVHNLPVVVPPQKVVERFEEIAMPLLLLRQRNEEESRTLAAIRDALLPKLLSGEVRVKQAERIVGEVV